MLGARLWLLADFTEEENRAGEARKLDEGTGPVRREPGSSPGFLVSRPIQDKTSMALWDLAITPSQPSQQPTRIPSARDPAPGWRQPTEQVVRRPQRPCRLISHRSPTHDVSAAKTSSLTAPALVT